MDPSFDHLIPPTDKPRFRAGIHTITLVFALIGAQRHKQTRQRVLFSAIPVVLWATALVFDVCSFVFSARALDAGEDTRSQHTYWEMHLDAGLNVAAGAAFFVSTVVTDGFLVSTSP